MKYESESLEQDIQKYITQMKFEQENQATEVDMKSFDLNFFKQ